jgi:spermidine synthase
MSDSEQTVFEFDTAYGHYQVVDMIYDDRPARVLFSGNRVAAQSGVAKDDNPELLFDYNQRMFELAVGVQPQRLLLIGGGMFTLPTALLAALPEIQIDVIELDSELAAIAERYFDLQPSSRLRIINQDGFGYLASNKIRYDMILVDAYTDATSEPTLASSEAISLLKQSLRPDGLIAANFIAAYYGRRSQSLTQLTKIYHEQFASVRLFLASRGLSLWLPQNLVLVAQQPSEQDIGQYLRYEALGEPEHFDLRSDLGLGKLGN